jgi:hypothetical protein
MALPCAAVILTAGPSGRRIPDRVRDDEQSPDRGAGLRSAGRSTLAPLRQQDEGEADDREDRASGDPRALVDHEARCRPMDQAGALADPQEPHQQREQAEDQQSRLHRAAY